MHIYGGDFIGHAEGVKAIYSENFTKFVSGGKFNTKITEYLTDDAKTTSSVIENNTKLDLTNNNKNNLIIIISSIIIIGIGTLLIYKNKNKIKNIFF